MADDAGRVVVLEQEVLRDGEWVTEVRLPKGRHQARETDARTALAEVRQRTGYQELEVLADLGRAPVEYVSRGIPHRRTEHFFLVRLRSLGRRETAAEKGPSPVVVKLMGSFEEALAALSFPSEQGALLRAKAWWPSSPSGA